MSIVDRLGRCLFVAAAVGLAWGIRGDFGHVIGAMYPGAVLGLAWVFVSGSPSLKRRMPIIAGLTAAGIGVGGMMSYGILHGYAQADSFQNYTYGFFTLFCQGGCWGIFGGTIAGLLVERRPMRTGDWLGLISCIFFGGWLFSTLVVELLGFHVNPPRNDISIAFLGAAIGLFGWLLSHNRPGGLRGGTYAFIGFGLGMAGGRLLANACRHLEAFGWTINHWNVMEITCGVVGGGVFTWGMLGLGRIEPDDESEEIQSLRIPNLLFAFFAVGLIPLWHLTARVPERFPKWSGQFASYGSSDPDGQAKLTLILIFVTCAVAAVGALVWAVAIFKGWNLPTWFPVVLLSACMLIFQNLTAHYFWYPRKSGALNTQNAFWMLFAIMIVYVLLSRPQSRPFDSALDKPLGWKRLLVGTVVSFAVIIALATFTNSERTMSTANTRWPMWTWSSGPFPGTANP